MGKIKLDSTTVSLEGRGTQVEDIWVKKIYLSMKNIALNKWDIFILLFFL
jgi:hypothetical protein